MIGPRFDRVARAQLLRRLERGLRRFRALPPGAAALPPILANSIPKSGTHLLVQALAGFPGAGERGGFIASTPSMSLRSQAEASLCRRIARIRHGEVCPAHLQFHDASAAALAARHVSAFLIVRDPRDVAISEAHYLTEMTRVHRAAGHFRRLDDWPARYDCAIQGAKDARLEGLFPDLGARLRPYLGWLEYPDICVVRFEDLVGPDRGAVLQRMAAHLAPGIDATAAAEAMAAAIQPSRSHTFRVGQAGRWREILTAEQVRRCREVAGDVIERLGYDA